LNLGDRGDIVSRSTSHIGMLHIFLCHGYHFWVSIPRNRQTMPKQRNDCYFYDSVHTSTAYLIK